ncbi:hypothetical protein BX070DRAFT_221318 [Coemansia spiralis]|nr:hypothetical protein BX070DRAFT_221318 [Coemansia spiralis]
MWISLQKSFATGFTFSFAFSTFVLPFLTEKKHSCEMRKLGRQGCIAEKVLVANLVKANIIEMKEIKTKERYRRSKKEMSTKTNKLVFCAS